MQLSEIVRQEAALERQVWLGLCSPERSSGASRAHTGVVNSWGRCVVPLSSTAGQRAPTAPQASNASRTSATALPAAPLQAPLPGGASASGGRGTSGGGRKGLNSGSSSTVAAAAAAAAAVAAAIGEPATPQLRVPHAMPPAPMLLGYGVQLGPAAGVLAPPQALLASPAGGALPPRSPQPPQPSAQLLQPRPPPGQPPSPLVLLAAVGAAAGPHLPGLGFALPPNLPSPPSVAPPPPPPPLFAHPHALSPPLGAQRTSPPPPLPLLAAMHHMLGPDPLASPATQPPHPPVPLHLLQGGLQPLPHGLGAGLAAPLYGPGLGLPPAAGGHAQLLVGYDGRFDGVA
jgi:hypothetical protein